MSDATPTEEGNLAATRCADGSRRCATASRPPGRRAGGRGSRITSTECPRRSARRCSASCWCWSWPTAAGPASGRRRRSTRTGSRSTSPLIDDRPRRHRARAAPHGPPAGGRGAGRRRPQPAVRHPRPAESTSSTATPCSPPSPPGSLDKSRPLGQILLERGAVDAETPRPARGAGPQAPAAARRRPRTRAWPRSARSARSASDLERVADPELQASLARVADRPTGRTDPDARPGTPRRAPPPPPAAVPHPPAPRPGRPGRGLRRPRRGAAPRGGPQGDPGPPRRRPGQPGPVPARGRDHRRAGAPGDRPGLRPGHLRRRPAVLRHAVHQGRQPQGRDRAVPRGGRPGPRPGRADAGAARAAAAGSSTSATRSPTPTAAACCTAT